MIASKPMSAPGHVFPSRLSSESKSESPELVFTYDRNPGPVWGTVAFALCVVGFSVGQLAGVSQAVTVWVILALGLPVGVWALYVGYKGHLQRRSKEMQQVADSLGFTYEADIPEQRLQQLAPVPLVFQGNRRSVANMLFGEYRGEWVMVVDFSFAAPSGDGDIWHVQTLAVFPQAINRNLDFELFPRNALVPCPG